MCKLKILTIIFLQFYVIESLSLLRNKRLAPLHEIENRKDLLIFTQVIWRHGDRAPERHFPSDPPNLWPGLAELTVKGMEQQLELGKKLRLKYIETHRLVSPFYNAREVYFRSSDTNRTLTSIQPNVIGFYGKGRRGIDYPDHPDWPEGFIVVPIHTIFNHYIKCAKADLARELLRQSPIYRRQKSKTESLFKQLSEITNTTVTLENSYYLYDVWHIHRLYNIPMPSGFTDELYEQFEVVEHVMNNYLYGVGIEPLNGMDVRRELTRLRGGPLLGTIIGHLKQKVSCKDKIDDKSCKWINDLKYYAFSLHDTSLEVIFSSFGFNEVNYRDHSEPGYAASLSFELWERPENQGFYVKVLYWPAENGTFDITADISGCQHECNLERFIQRTKPYLIGPDFQKECKLPEVPYKI